MKSPGIQLSLPPPPRNEKGEVIPHDCQEILPNDGIIRRISEQQLVYDEILGRKRISSLALKPSSGPNGGLSVDLQREIEKAGLDAKAFVTTPRWTGSIRFLAEHLRSAGCIVGFNPTTDNPYHGEVWGTFNRAMQNELFQLCEWFVEIKGAVLRK